MRYEIGDQLNIPKTQLRLIGGPISPGTEFKATDLGEIKSNDGETITFESFRLRIDELLADECVCTVIR